MTDINEVRERLERLADNAEMYGLRVLARPEHIRALLDDHARLRVRNAELAAAVRGLLDALPSSTTHPAIAAARRAVQP